MKKIIFFVLMLFLSVFCFAQNEEFVEEYNDIDFEQSQIQKEKELDKTNEEELNKINEFNIFKEQNEKEISEIQKKIEHEEDGIVRLELENQIKSKKIELQAKQYSVDWIVKTYNLTVQSVLKEAAKIKKQTSKLLDNYESILETKSDFLVDKDKMLATEEYDYAKLEENIIIDNKNKTLVSMVNTLKPFIEKLNKFQTNYFRSENDGKIKISSLYKSNLNFINIKIIYTNEQTAIYNLKYKISDFSKEEQSLIGKSSKEFIITPVFSITQNNDGSLAKVLTGFNVKNSILHNEQIIKIPANIKEIYEITRYKKVLNQYSE